MKYNFDEEKIKLENTFKSVVSIQKAKENIDSVLKYNQNLDLTALGAIFHSCIINYARPFTQNKIQNGKKYVFSFKAINSSKELDKELHDQILLLRNKVIAHSDIELVDSKIIYQNMVQTIVSQIPFKPIEADALVGICGNAELLLLPSSTKLLTRIQSHIKKVFNKSMDFLSDELLKHFQEIEKNQSIMDEIKKGAVDSITAKVPFNNAMNSLMNHKFTSINKNADQWGEFWFMNLKHTMNKGSNQYKLSSNVFFEKGGINKKFHRQKLK